MVVLKCSLDGGVHCKDNMKPPVLSEVLSSLAPLRAEFSASVSGKAPHRQAAVKARVRRFLKKAKKPRSCYKRAISSMVFQSAICYNTSIYNKLHLHEGSIYLHEKLL